MDSSTKEYVIHVIITGNFDIKFKRETRTTMVGHVLLFSHEFGGKHNENGSKRLQLISAHAMGTHFIG